MEKKIPKITVNGTVEVNEIPLRDRDAPEIYGDMCANIHSFNGNIVFTVATCRLTLTQTQPRAERVVSGRLILPLGAVVDLHNQLALVLQNIKQQNQQQAMLHSLPASTIN